MTRYSNRELYETAFPIPPDGRRAGFDYSIPQRVWEEMKPHEREHAVGWIYDNLAPTFGRLLTETECRDRIVERAIRGGIHKEG
jgi:hypothetical protein